MDGHSRGHDVYLSEETDKWHYVDNDDEVTYENEDKRPCKKCGKNVTKDGHDPCIANLPGVKFACCGHGKEKGYVSFGNGIVIRGHFDHVRYQGGSVDGVFDEDKFIEDHKDETIGL